MDKNGFALHNHYVEPNPGNDDDWPIGMLPGGRELRVVEMDGDAAEPTEENE